MVDSLEDHLKWQAHDSGADSSGERMLGFEDSRRRINEVHAMFEGGVPLSGSNLERCRNQIQPVADQLIAIARGRMALAQTSEEVDEIYSEAF